MFTSAIKSISSTISTNISSNYSYSTSGPATSTAGPWKIYEAKKKSTGKVCSLFVFDKRSLDAHSNGLGRSNATAFKRATEEVVERLRKEASSLARLRHPSILELVEPVEDTRGGGLQFVTEAVTASLAGLLQEKDEQERAGGVGGRSSRYVTEDADGTRRRREIEMDELEIQKGLLQISRALEFMHEKAGLVHGNLTPDAVLINTKGDWKLSGLAFCSPPKDSDPSKSSSSSSSSFAPVDLSETLNADPRLPRSVQLNLDYTSPDFVLDNNLTPSADMFSLGLLCVSLYNSPHRSPLECHASLSAYKRLFQSPSTVPSASNDFLCARPLPKDLVRFVLPRLVTRRPAQRMTAREFQQSEFFNNMLVSTIRFLDAFPAKTANEKAQFLRGLNKVLPSFPRSVMEKKVLPALLDEMKDRDLVSLILHNVFKIIDLLPSGRRAFGEKIRPSLKDIFVTNARPSNEKDAARDAGLMIVLEQLSVVAENCNGAEFKDDILPIIYAALESTTPSLIDAALRSLPIILPVLDFSTIKNELFPVVAAIFSRTTSLAIKVRGLQAFVILCGGSLETPGLDDDDGLDGIMGDGKKKSSSSSSALDKYTMQERIIPLVKAIKTKEPAVMLAALSLLRVVGREADADFVAMEILPILWHMSLGPLLDLRQFRAFMDLIKALSRRVEDEQSRKLQELGNGATAMPADDFMPFGPIGGSTSSAFDANGTSEHDFETLVKGGGNKGETGNPMDAWGELGSSMGPMSPTNQQPGVGVAAGKSMAPAFSWSTTTMPTPTPAANSSSSSSNNNNNPQFGGLQAQQSSFRTITPDFTGGMLPALTPSTTQFSQPLQPTTSSLQSAGSGSGSGSGSVNWAAAANSNPWSTSASAAPTRSTFSPAPSPATTTFGSQLQPGTPSFSLRPPPATGSSFSLAPPPGGRGGGGGGGGSAPMPWASGTMGASAFLAQRPGVMSSNGNGASSMNGTMAVSMAQMQAQQQQAQAQAQAQAQTQGSGLDKYASLL